MEEWSKEKFHAVYLRHVDMVYKLCRMYLKNDADAKDGVQEIFLKLWQKQPEFLDKEHEKAWLIRITKNYCINQLRSAWFRKRVEWKDNAEISVQDAAENQELLELVMSLPVKFREVMYLYYYEGYSIREMSALLARKESTIQSQLAAGRKKLRQWMADSGNSEYK